MQELIITYQEVFQGDREIRMIQSPLRICPLGAHIDHQKGIVTGMTLDSSVNLVYCANDDGLVQVKRLDFPDEENFHIDHVPGMIPAFWGNYLRGAVLALKQDHVLKKGINGVIGGKLPIGGLSSSAAVTTAYLMALCDVNGISYTKIDLIKCSHWVERRFIGLNNGILDQSVNILSEKDKLTVVDCNTLEYRIIPKPKNMPEFEIVIVYSGISKSLISTDYNNRVDECKVAAWLLQELAHQELASFSETVLNDVDESTYQALRSELPGRFRRRADHFFGEMQRVRAGIQAWEEGDLVKFGQSMFESGESSIKNYECGCPELISIYNIFRNTPGVYGARFSGAGYRGCCIGLVNPNYKDAIKATVDRLYLAQFPQYKDTYRVTFCKTDDGARIVDLPETIDQEANL